MTAVAGSGGIYIGATPQPKTGARQSKASQERAPENNKAPSGDLAKNQKLRRLAKRFQLFSRKEQATKVEFGLHLHCSKAARKILSLRFCFQSAKGKYQARQILSTCGQG